jgi:hypothetical protein
MVYRDEAEVEDFRLESGNPTMVVILNDNVAVDPR